MASKKPRFASLLILLGFLFVWTHPLMGQSGFDCSKPLGADIKRIVDKRFKEKISEEEIQRLGAAMLDPANYTHVIHAARALALIKRRDALPYVEKCLESSKEGGLLEECPKLTGLLRAKGAVQTLITIMQKDKPVLSGYAAAALGVIADPAAIPYLIESSKNCDNLEAFKSLRSFLDSKKARKQFESMRKHPICGQIVKKYTGPANIFQKQAEFKSQEIKSLKDVRGGKRFVVSMDIHSDYQDKFLPDLLKELHDTLLKEKKVGSYLKLQKGAISLAQSYCIVLDYGVNTLKVAAYPYHPDGQRMLEFLWDRENRSYYDVHVFESVLKGSDKCG